MKARKFLRFEVVSGGETLRVFRKTSEAEALAFAKAESLTRSRSVVVDAVSQNGTTGQRTTQVAGFLSGERI